MDAVQVLDDVLTVIRRVRKNGRVVVSSAALEEWLSKVRDAVAKIPAGEQLPNQQRLEVMLHESRVQADADLEMFKSVIAAGQSTLNAATLVNGGAAVALLAFLGTGASVLQTFPRFNAMAASMLFFGGGVLCAGLASGMTYLAQAAFHDGRDGGGLRWNGLAKLLALLSFVLFAGGCWSAYRALVTT